MNLQNKIWTTISLINWGCEYLLSKNIANAKLEVEWFLCSILNCKRIDLYVQFEQPLMKSELAKFKIFIRRRANGEPFQHIIGKSDFYGRDFIVNKNVLVPRPETELIIEILRKQKKIEKVLEIGTGSGCLAITMELENISSSIIATDISKNAIIVAEQNLESYNCKNIELKLHNFLQTKINSTFDVVVSNPPYIGINEIPNLQNEVKNYDPIIALSDNKDGLVFYHRFAEIGTAILNKNGFLLLEFGGENQLDDIKTIFNSKYYDLTFYNDLQKNPRVVKVSLLS